MGFDPGSPGSRPEPKAGAKPLRHPGIPSILYNCISAVSVETFPLSLMVLPESFLFSFGMIGKDYLK